MTTYSKIWDNTNFTGKRAMDKIESEGAKMWKVGKTRSLTNNTVRPVNVSPTRTLNTVYTNGAKSRLLMVSVEMVSVAAGSARATIETPDGTARAFIEEAGLALTVASPIFWVVQPNDTYEIVSSTTGVGSSVTLLFWYEFDFDAVTAASTYTNGEVPPVTKLNNYLHAVNDLCDTEGALTFGAAAAIDTEKTIGAKTTFVSYSTEVIDDGADDGSATLQQKDSGGALTNVGRIFNSSAVDSVHRQLAAVVNPDGAYKLVTTSGAVAVVYSWEVELKVRTAIADFATGDGPSTTVGNKFRDADTNASKAVNTTEAFTRTERTANTDSVTPSATKWSVAIVQVQLQPGTLAQHNVSIDLRVDTVIRATCFNNGTGSDSHAMMIAIVPPNKAYDLVITTNNSAGAVIEKWDWVVNV